MGSLAPNLMASAKTTAVMIAMMIAMMIVALAGLPAKSLAAAPPVQETPPAQAAPGSSQANAPENAVWYSSERQFRGFRKRLTTVAGRKAFVVLPDSPAAGNPWVWRARFPGFHADADVELLRRGFHVGYVDVAGLFGGPQAMEIGDAFYTFAVDTLGLHPKPTLEGVSRGGLFIYRYLVAHPDRVTAIYADTAVCDFNSWPGGTGAGVGSPKDWQKCLEAYGITAAEAAESEVTPLALADQIAESGVPLLHIVSRNDTVVPPAENTDELRRRVERAGGRLDVIDVPEGTEKSRGHHFEHPDVDQVVRFITHHTEAPLRRRAKEQAETSEARLAMLSAAKRVVFLGDSVTYAGDYVAAFEAWLRTRLPPEEMPQIINVGLPSETVSGLSESGHAGGRFPRPDVDQRIGRVLAEIKPDVVFACYGINCGIYQPRSPQRLAAFTDGIDRLHRKIVDSGAAVIHLTPIAYDDVRSERTADGERFEYNRVLEEFADSLRRRRDDPAAPWSVIDVHRELTETLERRRRIDPDFFFARDGVHPDAAGHWQIAATLIRWFGDPVAAAAPDAAAMMRDRSAAPDALAGSGKRMRILRDAFLTATGHTRPGIRDGLPVDEALRAAAATLAAE